MKVLAALVLLGFATCSPERDDGSVRPSSSAHVKDVFALATPTVSVSSVNADSATIDLADLTSFGCATVDLFYDNTAVTVEGATIGFAGFGGDLTSNIQNILGKARFVITTSAIPGPDAPLTLVSLRLKGRRAGQSNLTLAVPTLCDTDGTTYTPTLVDGVVTLPAPVVDMGHLDVTVDGTITKALYVQDAPGVASVNAIVLFNPLVVSITATAGDFTSFFAADTSVAGRININSFVIGTNLVGQVKIAELQLTAVPNAITRGYSILDLDVPVLTDSDAQDVPRRVVDGRIDVSYPDNPANATVKLTSAVVLPGQSFDLVIEMDPKGTAISGAQANISFDSSRLQVNSVTEGNLFTQGGASTFFSGGTIDNAAGTVKNTFCVILGAFSVSGAGTYLTLNLTAGTTAGTSTVELWNVKISTPAGTAVPFSGTDGTVTIDTPPVLAGVGDRTVDEGQPLTFVVSATDADLDPLTYSASNLPPGATFDPATRTFTWTPTYAQAGTYSNVQFAVADGWLSASEAITVTVANIDRCLVPTVVVCQALDQCHDAGVCNSDTGLCSNPLKTDGTSCDDASACTAVDSCAGGVCTGAQAVVCTAADSCHEAGQCNPVTGACSSPQRPDGTACDDSDECTDLDQCQLGACAGTTKPDGAPCSTGVCQQGACGPAPEPGPSEGPPGEDSISKGCGCASRDPGGLALLLVVLASWVVRRRAKTPG